MIDPRYKLLWEIMKVKGYLALSDFRFMYPKGNFQSLINNMQNAGYLMYDDEIRLDQEGREVPLAYPMRGTKKIAIVKPMEGVDHERRIIEIEEDAKKAEEDAAAADAEIVPRDTLGNRKKGYGKERKGWWKADGNWHSREEDDWI